jgi:hypothetical protein
MEVENQFFTLLPLYEGTFPQAGCSAGVWRGLEVAVKTIIFSCSPSADEADGIAKEAAFAINLCHSNVVNTYDFEIKDVQHTPVGAELEICKFYLIQVQLPAIVAVVLLNVMPPARHFIPSKRAQMLALACTETLIILCHN